MVSASLSRCADCSDSWEDSLVGAGLRIGPAVYPPRILREEEQWSDKHFLLFPSPAADLKKSRCFFPWLSFFSCCLGCVGSCRIPLVDSFFFLYTRSLQQVSDIGRRKMSTPRFKKDKEIITDYESQVKGKGRVKCFSGKCACKSCWENRERTNWDQAGSSLPAWVIASDGGHWLWLVVRWIKKESWCKWPPFGQVKRGHVFPRGPAFI